MPFNRPLLIVIGGPNGSGKTTLSSYLLEKGRIKTNIINPDKIAFEELGSYHFQFQAARIALLRRKEALERNESFTFESTFYGNSEVNDIKAAKQKGYRVLLYYIALQSVMDNITRVEERHTQLGHRVNNEDIIRRYQGSQFNLLDNISLFDTAYLFDNSGSFRSRVAIFSNGNASWVNPKHTLHPFFKGLFS
jgi:predicted ABC-type ATPase